MDLKNCTAMDGGDVCIICGHSIDEHEHTFIIKVKEKSIQYVPSTRVVSKMVTNKSQKARFEIAQQNLQTYQSQLAKLNKEIRQLENELESAYKKMAFLYNQINSTSMKPINDKFLEHLDCCEKNLKENCQISNADLKGKLLEIETSRKRYLLTMEVTKKAMQNHQSGLNQTEQMEIQNDLAKMLKHEAQALEL